jgi:hypothetical protein
VLVAMRQFFGRLHLITTTSPNGCIANFYLTNLKTWNHFVQDELCNWFLFINFMFFYIDDFTFQMPSLEDVCRDGNLEELKKLLDTGTNAQRAFNYVCFNGYIQIAKWLLSIVPSIKVRKDCAEPFSWACTYGHLDVAKWLLSVKPSIDVRAYNDEAFRDACKYGQVHVAKWLLTIEALSDIRTYRAALHSTCTGGHLKVAKWLLSVGPSIDVLVLKNSAFNLACENGHLKVAKWLQRKFLFFKDDKTKTFRKRRVVQF